MDKTIFYRKLDIDGPEEFIYYDNISALLEEDEYIEENLIVDLLRNVDMDTFAELLDTFFEEFLDDIPDEETDLYITIESIRSIFRGLTAGEPEDIDIGSLAAEIINFRKWYVTDKTVTNKLKGSECSVRDARYDVLAAGLLSETCDFDFGGACDYYTEGYDYKLGNIEIRENDID